MAKTLQIIIFFVMSTLAMFAIAIGILAQPFQQYVLDQKVINKHERFVESLEAYRDEQNVLLQNVDNPSVVARAAINHFNYSSVESAQDQSPRDKLVGMPESFDKALAQLNVARIDEVENKSRYLSLILALADAPVKCNALIILGVGLVVVCLTFYTGSSFFTSRC